MSQLNPSLQIVGAASGAAPQTVSFQNADFVQMGNRWIAWYFIDDAVQFFDQQFALCNGPGSTSGTLYAYDQGSYGYRNDSDEMVVAMIASGAPPGTNATNVAALLNPLNYTGADIPGQMAKWLVPYWNSYVAPRTTLSLRDIANSFLFSDPTSGGQLFSLMASYSNITDAAYDITIKIPADVH